MDGRVASRGARRVPVGQVMLIASVGYLLPLLANVGASFFTEWTRGGTWLIAPALGVAAAIGVALFDAYLSTPALGPDVGSPWPGERTRPLPPAAFPQRGKPLPVVLVVAVLVIGVGGLAAAQGVRYAVGWVTGNEPGVERLVQVKSGSNDGVTLTVESVEQTAHFTRVDISVTNNTRMSISLPVFGYSLLRGSGNALKGDSFRSGWSETVAPGTQHGTVVFKGHLPDNVRLADFGFTQVFGGFFNGPLMVTDMRLQPPEGSS